MPELSHWWNAYAAERVVMGFMRRIRERAISERFYKFRAHCVVTLDAKTQAVKHVGIYSFAAKDLTIPSHDDCLLDGPSQPGRTFEEARSNLLGVLRNMPFFRWMYDRLPETEKMEETEE